MCGITGCIGFQSQEQATLSLNAAVKRLFHRGPDHTGVYVNESVALGHTRLSIIDTSPASHQPFFSDDQRYVLVYNGEIFNYAAIRTQLESNGIQFRTQGDAEVLLHLFVREGLQGLHQIRGFFACCIWDQHTREAWIFRDRLGVKPLFYAIHGSSVAFASEMQALMEWQSGVSWNPSALYAFFRLNYGAGHQTCVKDLFRLLPGQVLHWRNGEAKLKSYYELPKHKKASPAAGNRDIQNRFRALLEESVSLRLVSDVPLGSFLSGGIDSTVVTGMAAQLKPGLETFCLGFKNNPHFDESRYAEIAAEKFKTNHTTIQVSPEDVLGALDGFLAHLDEPFADSSAINVFMLSREVAKRVKVVLSGDGADELLAGYNKHRAEWMMRQSSWINTLHPLWYQGLRILPKSRQGYWSNRFRQLEKYGKMLRLSKLERIREMCCISNDADVSALLQTPYVSAEATRYFEQLFHLPNQDDFNAVLYNDMQLVLPYDMLVKVDMMSMAHALEVRNPFLDVQCVEFMMNMQAEYKITPKVQKWILKEACKDIIPPALLHRSKHGFEVPLGQWFRGPLRQQLEQKWLNEEYLDAIGIFRLSAIRDLRKTLFSSSPGDSPARVWAILTLTSWWDKNRHQFKSFQT